MDFFDSGASALHVRNWLTPAAWRARGLWTRFRRVLGRAPSPRYCFVHINKTAGTSISSALGLRRRHLTALDWIASMGADWWRRRFTFAIVRNPWDRVVSQYHYRVRTDQTALGSRPIPFREWVLRCFRDRDPRWYDKPRMFQPQVEWIADGGGRILVRFVGRFEHLADDFRLVCARLGIDRSLPHLERSVHAPFRECYDDETAEVVGRWFAADVERFGYSFDGDRRPVRPPPSGSAAARSPLGSRVPAAAAGSLPRESCRPQSP